MRIRELGCDETAPGLIALLLGHRGDGSGTSAQNRSIVLYALLAARPLTIAWPCVCLIAALLWPTFGHAADTSTGAWQRVQRVFDEIRARYPGRIDEEALANRAIQAMLQGLDRHSEIRAHTRRVLFYAHPDLLVSQPRSRPTGDNRVKSAACSPARNRTPSPRRIA